MKRFERPTSDPGFKTGQIRTFDGDDASEGEFVETTSVDSRPIGVVHVYACQRPWVTRLNRLRGKKVNAMVMAAWNPGTRSAMESSHEYIEKGHSYMEIHPTSDPSLLSSAQLAVYHRINERTEVEFLLNTPIEIGE
ncbi:hypothetical protein N9260_02180 [bacterium]|nr:hypothetical protein [bacterium]